MDFRSLVDSVQSTMGGSLPSLLDMVDLSQRIRSNTDVEVDAADMGAIAVSFGLRGREVAGRQMEYWLSGLRKE